MSLVVVPPPTTCHIAIAIVATSAPSVIQAISPAIVLASAIMMLLVTITSASSLLTLLSRPPQCWRRSCGLRLVNTSLPQLLLKVCLLPRDPLPGLPLRVEVTLINLDLDTTLHLNCYLHPLH